MELDQHLRPVDHLETEPNHSTVSKLQSNNDLALFFDLSLDLFCIANMDGYFVRINPNFSKVLGYSDAELMSRPFLDFVHADDQPATTTEVLRLQQGLDVVRFRNRYRDVCGHYHTFEWTAKSDGSLAYAVARNLSDQLRLEASILNHQMRERDLLDHTPAVIYVKGVDHRYQFINRQFAELYHLDREATIGKTENCIFSTEIAEHLIANHDEVLRTGHALTVEEQVSHENGMHTYLSLKFPLFDSNGEIAAVAGISTDISDRVRAREAEQELELAQVFQRTLYPSHPPEIKGLEIAGSAFPVSQVCGDYYDFIPLGDQRVAISLGDVSGHGYKPALQMVELRTSLRILLRKVGELSATVEELNNILCDDFEAVPSFVSFFLASIDVQAHALRYIGAGHDAFIFKADGRTITLDSTGLVLGVISGEVYPEAEPLPWDPGDMLVVFTDGFNEATNHLGEQFGKVRVLESLAEKRHHSARAMIDNLLACVKQHAGDVLLQDDMTVVVVKATA